MINSPSADVPPQMLTQPAWDGSPIERDTLLIWADPTFMLGDTVQFLRYVPLAAARGVGRIVVECHPALRPLVERMPCVSQVVPKGGTPPRCDVQASFLMLPKLLGFDGPRDMPSTTPYLTASEPLIRKWRDRLGSGGDRTIGIVWAADSTHITARGRSVSLSAFSALASLPRTRLISLQLGAPAAELFPPPPGLVVERFLDRSSSIDETAALMMNLDLIISVETMVPHLAGALGRPVWLLTQYLPGWRWGNDGDDTRWYPTMRLFRQTRAREWGEVFERVRQALLAS